jgi:hypothetical protein
VVGRGVPYESDFRRGIGRREVELGDERVERFGIFSVDRRDQVAYFEVPLGRRFRQYALDVDATTLRARADNAEARVAPTAGRNNVGNSCDELGRVPAMARRQHRDNVTILIDGNRINELVGIRVRGGREVADDTRRVDGRVTERRYCPRELRRLAGGPKYWRHGDDRGGRGQWRELQRGDGDTEFDDGKAHDLVAPHPLHGEVDVARDSTGDECRRRYWSGRDREIVREHHGGHDDGVTRGGDREIDGVLGGDATIGGELAERRGEVGRERRHRRAGIFGNEQARRSDDERDSHRDRDQARGARMDCPDWRARQGMKTGEFTGVDPVTCALGRRSPMTARCAPPIHSPSTIHLHKASNQPTSREGRPNIAHDGSGRGT